MKNQYKTVFSAEEATKLGEDMPAWKCIATHAVPRGEGYNPTVVFVMHRKAVR